MENWKIGKHPSTVVSDVKVKNTNFPVPLNPEESRDEDVEHYGGYLVCESIGNEQHAKIIASAMEMKHIIEGFLMVYGGQESRIIKDARKLLFEINYKKR